jgi:hypothetical protein
MQAFNKSPKNGFATSEVLINANLGTASDTIANANLYFASWIVFAASASIIASILKDKGLFDAKVSWAAMSKTMGRWFLLLVSSMVVLITSSLLTKNTRRQKYAVSVGAICSALPFLIICGAMVKCTLGTIYQLILSVLVVALYCVEVGKFRIAMMQFNSICYIPY